MPTSLKFRQKGKSARETNKNALLLISLVVIIINGALSYMSSDNIDPVTYEVITNDYAIYFSILSLLISTHLSYGLYSASLKSVRHQSVEFSEILCGFKKYGKILLAGILMSVYVLLWSLLLVIPGIIAAYKYSMTLPILMDNPDMSANEAITASKNLMDGHKWQLFCLHFSFIGWFILGALTAGILYIWILPHLTCSEMAFYEHINKPYSDRRPQVIGIKPEDKSQEPTDSWGEPL